MKQQQKEGMMFCRYCNRPKLSLSPCDCERRTRWRIGNNPRLNSKKKRATRLRKKSEGGNIKNGKEKSKRKN